MLLQVESVFGLFYLSHRKENDFNTNRTRTVTWKIFDFSILTIATTPPAFVAARSWLLFEVSSSGSIIEFEKVEGRYLLNTSVISFKFFLISRLIIKTKTLIRLLTRDFQKHSMLFLFINIFCQFTFDTKIKNKLPSSYCFI